MGYFRIFGFDVSDLFPMLYREQTNDDRNLLFDLIIDEEKRSPGVGRIEVSGTRILWRTGDPGYGTFLARDPKPSMDPFIREKAETFSGFLKSGDYDAFDEQIKNQEIDPFPFPQLIKVNPALSNTVTLRFSQPLLTKDWSLAIVQRQRTDFDGTEYAVAVYKCVNKSWEFWDNLFFRKGN